MFTDDVESVCSFSVVGEKTDNIVTEQPREGKQRESANLSKNKTSSKRTKKKKKIQPNNKNK